MGGNEVDPKTYLAHLVVDRVRAETGADPKYDPSSYAIRYGGDDHILYLDNLYDETSGAGDSDLATHVDHFVTTMLAANDRPGSWDEALSRLRPILRPSTYTLGSSPSGLLVSRRVFPLVDEMIAVDLPGKRTVVSWEAIDAWGVDPASVFSAARSNLATITVHADPTKGRAVQRLVDNGNRYFTSWLLDPGWLESHRGRFGCAPVAFIPDTDTILVVPGDDPDEVHKHFDAVEQQYVHTARALSPQAYTVDDAGTVVTFDRIDPADPSAARARCVHISREYEAQASWLTRQYDLDHVRSVVGTVTIKTTSFGPRTVTIWSEGIDCTLPRADLVAFCSNQAPPFYVQFDDVEAIIGPTPISGLEPTRYRVHGWPDAELMTMLRAHSIRVD